MQILLPALRAERVSEECRLVRFLQTVAPRFLLIRPASRQVGYGINRFIDHGSVAYGGADHLEPVRDERSNERIELSGIHRRGLLVGGIESLRFGGVRPSSQ